MVVPQLVGNRLNYRHNNLSIYTCQHKLVPHFQNVSVKVESLEACHDCWDNSIDTHSIMRILPSTLAVSTSAEINAICLCVSPYSPTISSTDQFSNSTLGKTESNNHAISWIYTNLLHDPSPGCSILFTRWSTVFAALISFSHFFWTSWVDSLYVALLPSGNASHTGDTMVNFPWKVLETSTPLLFHWKKQDDYRY